MGNIINGREISNNIKDEIREYVKNEKFKVPKIVSILVGNDGGSIYYQNYQEKSSRDLGIDFEKIILDETTDEKILEDIILKLNNDDNVDGIMLLLPLPKHIDEKRITNLISLGRFYKGEKSFIPCTPYSVITLLKRSNVELLGKHVVIIGRSNIVGKPLIQMFLNENSTVTVCHSKTNNLKEITKCADILVVAIGKPKFIDDSYVKEDAIVIDVGTSNVDGQITGDVDFDKVVSKASMISKVPGGVGALTTVLLFKNLCEGLK